MCESGSPPPRNAGLGGSRRHPQRRSWRVSCSAGLDWTSCIPPLHLLEDRADHVASDAGMGDRQTPPWTLHLKAEPVFRFALAVAPPDLGIAVELVILALQLPENLAGLEDSGRSHGVHGAEQPARQVGRALAGFAGVRVGQVAV